MDNELTFSLSYELLMQKAEEAEEEEEEEEEIRNINLEQGGIGYIEIQARASGILSFWFGLAIQGYPGTTMDERVNTDRIMQSPEDFPDK